MKITSSDAILSTSLDVGDTSISAVLGFPPNSSNMFVGGILLS